MSNINKQELREAAEKADSIGWDGIEYELDVGPRATEFISRCSPAAVLALLDELEEKDKRLNEILTPNMLLPVIDDMDEDNLRHVIKTVCENYSLLHAKWEAAEKRIAELESERDKQGRHACELFDEVTSQRQQIAELEAAGIITKVGE